MCVMLGAGALAGAQFAVSALSSVVGFVGQMQQYNAQKAMYKQNVENANEYARTTYAYTQNRALQEKAAASLEKSEANINAAEARATAAVAAGDGGVMGNSITSLLGSYYSKQGRYNDALDNNFQMSRDSLWASMDQTRNQAQSQINSMPTPQRPSFLDAGIRIAAGGLNAASSYNRMVG